MPQKITVTDCTGATVELVQPLERIVCLNRNAAEVLAAIGAGDRIVGVSESFIQDGFIMNHIPNGTSVGNYWIPDVEKIISLHPDAVIVFGNPGSRPQNLDKILAANLTVIYVNCYNIRTLPNETRMLGRITGREDAAEQYSRYTEKYLSLVNGRLENISDKTEPRVYFESWNDYTVLAPDTFLNDVFRMVHAGNIAENISQGGEVSPEWVVEQNPDIIVKIVTYGNDLPSVHENVMTRLGSSHIRAVQDGKVYVLYYDMMASPRGSAGLVYLSKAVYPERFTDVDPQQILQEYSDKFLPGSNPGIAFYPGV